MQERLKGEIIDGGQQARIAYEWSGQPYLLDPLPSDANHDAFPPSSRKRTQTFINVGDSAHEPLNVDDAPEQGQDGFHRKGVQGRGWDPSKQNTRLLKTG